MNNAPLLVLVPYRDRAQHLRIFLRRVWEPLHAEYPNARLLIAEQSRDNQRFNRGALLNAAYDYAQSTWGVQPARVLLHDVDLVPDARLRRLYHAIPARVEAVAFGQAHGGRYPGRAFFGGITALSGNLFRRAGGFPTTFWGWGGEDDALRRRVIACGARITVPRAGSYRDQEQLSLQQKLARVRAARSGCPNRRELRDCTSGLDNTRYRVITRVHPWHVVFGLTNK